MFEIVDPLRRAGVLGGLGGVVVTVTLSFDGEIVKAVVEADVDRTTSEGKASSVQFLHFPFTPAQIDRFRGSGARVTLAIGHDHYGHAAILPTSVREALAADFD